MACLQTIYWHCRNKHLWVHVRTSFCHVTPQAPSKQTTCVLRISDQVYNLQSTCFAFGGPWFHVFLESHYTLDIQKMVCNHPQNSWNDIHIGYKYCPNTASECEITLTGTTQKHGWKGTVHAAEERFRRGGEPGSGHPDERWRRFWRRSVEAEQPVSWWFSNKQKALSILYDILYTYI